MSKADVKKEALSDIASQKKYIAGYKTGANAVANYVAKDFGKPRDPYQKNYHKDMSKAEEFDSVEKAFAVSETLLDKSRFDKRSQYWSIFVSTKSGEVLKEKIFPYDHGDACLNYGDVTEAAKELMSHYVERGDLAAAQGVLALWKKVAADLGAREDESELRGILA